MKTREDYLITFTERLLDSLIDVFKSIGRNLATAYGLALLLALFKLGSISELTVFGAKISVRGSDAYIFIPIFMSILYVLVIYQLTKITHIYKDLYNISGELTELNSESMPISLTDTRHFESGIAGMIISLARWQANRLLTADPFRLPELNPKENLFALGMHLLLYFTRIIWWIISISPRVLTILFLFILPLVLASYYVYQEFYSETGIIVGVALIPFSALLIMGIATIAFAVILFVSHIFDLLEGIRSNISIAGETLSRRAANILQYKSMQVIKDYISILLGPILGPIGNKTIDSLQHRIQQAREQKKLDEFIKWVRNTANYGDKEEVIDAFEEFLSTEPSTEYRVKAEKEIVAILKKLST